MNDVLKQFCVILVLLLAEPFRCHVCHYLCYSFHINLIFLSLLKTRNPYSVIIQNNEPRFMVIVIICLLTLIDKQPSLQCLQPRLPQETIQQIKKLKSYGIKEVINREITSQQQILVLKSINKCQRITRFNGI